MSIEYILIAVSILFIGALARSTFGFGDALIAMPLLALFLSVKLATPVVAIFGFIISIWILRQKWRTIDFSQVKWLIIMSIIGIPIGLIWLKGAAEDLVKIVLAVMLIVFSVFKILKFDSIKLPNNKFSPIFGIAAGMLGGAYNTNGPPIIIFGTLRKWPALKFRAILQAVFLPTNLFITISHGIAGLWTADVIKLFLISLPFVLIAILLGNRFAQKIMPERMTGFMYWFLLLIASILLFQTILS